MAIEHWENSDQFDNLRDKSNANFDEIGKVRRDASQDLSYLQDIISGVKGIEIDNTDPGGLLKIALSGLAANSGKYVRSDGTNISWSGLDIQTTLNYYGTLKPTNTASGDVMAGPITVPNYGHNMSYLFIATFQMSRDTTSPVHNLRVRLNGSTIKDLAVSIAEAGSRFQYTIAGVVTGVAPGSVFDIFALPVGSSNQYYYYLTDLTVVGIPS